MRSPLSLAGLALAAGFALAGISSAQTVTWCLNLDGAQAGNASPGTGVGTATLDTATNLFSWDYSFQGMLGAPTVAHFHGPAMPGMNAGIQVPTGGGNPEVGSAFISASQASDLLAGLWYLNVHSSMFPAGEIRDQVDHECFAVLCSALPNSTGNGATLVTDGNLLAAANALELVVADAPPMQFGFMLIGMGSGVFMPPGSGGNICIGGGAIGRFNRPGEIVLSSAAGTLTFTPNIGMLPSPPGGAVAGGQSWNFQAWFRDTTAAPGAQSNFSDAITIDFR